MLSCSAGTVARLIGSIAYLGLPVYDSLITRRWWSVARYFAHTPYFSLSNRIGAVLQMRCGQFIITCLSSLRVLHAQSSIRFLLGGPHKVPQSPFASDIASQELSRRTSGRVMFSHLGSESLCFRSNRDSLSIARILR